MKERLSQLGCLSIIIIVIVIVFNLPKETPNVIHYQSLREAENACHYKAKMQVLGKYAPDDLSFWDDDPSNDPKWEHPTVNLKNIENIKNDEYIKLEYKYTVPEYNEEGETYCMIYTEEKGWLFFASTEYSIY